MPESRLERLRRLLLAGPVRFGDFLLSSGKRSDVYVDGRLLTLSSEGAALASELLWERIEPLGVDAVGGMTMGADPIVGALLDHAGRRGVELNGFLVRKEAKAHGTKKRVEGPRPDEPHPRVVMVDDTATTGGSTLRAIECVREEWDAEVVLALFIVDREEGATQNLEGAGVRSESLVRLRELRE